MDSLEGELSEDILEVGWAREGRCSSIKNLWLALLAAPVLTERRIGETSKGSPGSIHGRIIIIFYGVW